MHDGLPSDPNAQTWMVEGRKSSKPRARRARSSSATHCRFRLRMLNDIADKASVERSCVPH
jgi:hypothetical protein